VGLLTVPQPYDFERSLDRFTFWGVDRANVWHDGGLYRVVDGREVRIAPANGGVQVEPLDAVIEPVVRKLLGLELELDPFYAFALGDAVLARAVQQLRGYRPPLAPDPFEALVSSITAQQVSLHSAFAVRSRLIERFGVPGNQAVAFPTRERIASATEDELTELGFSRRKAEYVLGVAPRRPGLRRARGSFRRRRKGADHGAARAGRVECGLVPRPPPRQAGGLARRRPRPAQGSARVLP
jgi:hypothetical protein